MVGRKEKAAAIILSAVFMGCGAAGDEACSSVSVVGSNSQATCNGNNTQQASGDITEDQAADICCTQDKVDSLQDDDCLKEIGYHDTNLCRSGDNSSGDTPATETLEFT